MLLKMGSERNISLNGKGSEVLNEFRYLGVMIIKGGSEKVEAEERITQRRENRGAGRTLVNGKKLSVESARSSYISIRSHSIHRISKKKKQ